MDAGSSPAPHVHSGNPSLAPPESKPRSLSTLIMITRPKADGAGQEVLLGMKKRGFGEGAFCASCLPIASTVFYHFTPRPLQDRDSEPVQPVAEARRTSD